MENRFTKRSREEKTAALAKEQEVQMNVEDVISAAEGKPEEKKTETIEKTQAKTKTRTTRQKTQAKTSAKKIKEVTEKNLEKKAEETIEKTDSGTTDFRNLKDPERTLKRMKYILTHPNLTSTFRAAAALLVAEFYKNDDHHKKLNISTLFPSPEFTQRTRIEMMKELEKLGLIKRNVVRREGQDITLLF